MRNRTWVFGLAALVAGSVAALAQDTEPPKGGVGVITGGSSNVSAGGQGAARQGDTTDDGNAVVEGSPNVFINGRPAVTVGDKTGCGGIAIGGASNVFVNGKPLARTGDLTSGCPGK
jgi:uncharacterized Zn-binding protein involved in type VI secretion